MACCMLARPYRLDHIGWSGGIAGHWGPGVHGLLHADLTGSFEKLRWSSEGLQKLGWRLSQQGNPAWHGSKLLCS
jgi:hypothetical protein